MQHFRCRECLYNGIIVNCASKGNMESHLGMVHSMGPWRCSVCAYTTVRREYVQTHINRECRSGQQTARHGRAVPVRSGAMSLALNRESGLCQLPHTVVWPNQAAAAPVTPPHAAPPIVAHPPSAPLTVAPALSGSSASVVSTSASSGNDSNELNDEAGEMDEDKADDLNPSSPTPTASTHTILGSKVADIIRRATVIGRYHMDRIDELSIPEGTYDNVGTDGRLVQVNPIGTKHNAAMVLSDAIKRLESAKSDLRDDGLPEDQLEKLAMKASEAISQMPVALTWYSRVSTRKGNIEDDVGRLNTMYRSIVDKFDGQEEKEDEDKMQEDGGER